MHARLLRYAVALSLATSAASAQPLRSLVVGPEATVAIPPRGALPPAGAPPGAAADLSAPAAVAPPPAAAPLPAAPAAPVVLAPGAVGLALPGLGLLPLVAAVALGAGLAGSGGGSAGAPAGTSR